MADEINGQCWGPKSENSHGVNRFVRNSRGIKQVSVYMLATEIEKLKGRAKINNRTLSHQARVDILRENARG